MAANKIFTVPNGFQVKVTEFGALYISPPGADNWLRRFAEGSRMEKQALAQYFEAQNDEKLGRWRSPDWPDHVVYPLEDGVRVRVLNEKTGAATDRHRGDSGGGDAGEVARHYFAAHMPAQPWYDPKPNDLWALSITGAFGTREVYRFSIEHKHGVKETYFRPVNSPTRFAIKPTDPAIVGAEKIWPTA